MKFRFTIDRFSLITLLLLMPVFFSCTKDSTSMNPNYQISLTVEAGVTEVWITVQKEEAETGQQVVLRRGNTEIHRFAAVTDTSVIDQGLQPAHSYNYTAQLLEGGKMLKQAVAAVTTMDTTSHNFQWELIEFPSPYGSGVLRDVAIINENDIWAVGEIYSDSAQPWLPYNAVHWDGSEWELRHITYNGSPWSIKSVFAFSSGDIWFDAFVMWNGVNFIELPIPNILIGYGINTIWGTSGNDLYVAGTQGLIAHYDGQGWRRIESGTDLALGDIWGVSENEVYVVGLHYGQLKGVVLKYDGSRWEKMIEGYPTFEVDSTELFGSKIYGTTAGVWVDEHGALYIVGNLMYQYKLRRWNFMASLPENYPGGNQGNSYRGYLHAVRGMSSNDIFIFGESNTIIHFNGMAWKKIGPEYIPWSYHFWYKADIHGNFIVAVGKTSGPSGPRARIIHLWR